MNEAIEGGPFETAPRDGGWMDVEIECEERDVRVLRTIRICWDGQPNRGWVELDATRHRVRVIFSRGASNPIRWWRTAGEVRQAAEAAAFNAGA